MSERGVLPTAPGRVLIVLLGAIGDVVRAMPLVQRLRAAWPECEITWAVEPTAAPLLDGHPVIDRVLVFERSRGARAFAPFLNDVRRVRADVTLDLQRHLKSGVTSWYSRAPVRVGFHRKNSREGNWLFNTHTIPAAAHFSSKVKQFLSFAEFFGISASPVDFGLAARPAEREHAARLLGTAAAPAALFVGSTWPSRRWLPDHTAAVCRDLTERGLDPVLLGAPADAPFAKAVMEKMGTVRVINLAGRTSLRDVVALLSRAVVAIGPDSGPMHIAAAVGTPVVSLWGATSPARSAPYGFEHLAIQGEAPCAPCYLRRCPIGRLCMESIRAAAVMERVDKALGMQGREDPRAPT